MARRNLRKPAALAAATVLVTSGALAVLTPTVANATPVARQVRVANTDWVSAGVGGIGGVDSPIPTGQTTAPTGAATITISGVSGTVTGAYLSWSGIGPFNGNEYNGAYNNPNITVNGQAVSGVSQGESGSNCWGADATSRTYLANVTTIVKAAGGNGVYSLAGLGDGGDANGAHLVVTYSDGDATNNKDLYLFYGNDTDADGFPGEDSVWNDPLTGINYQGGVAQLQLAVADGQDFGNPDDGDLTVTGPAGDLTFADTDLNNGLWDGTTVADMGFSRAPNGSLYDLETFDVTAAMGDPGVQDLAINSPLDNDCHSLVMAAVSVQATGNVPPPGLTASISPASDVEGTKPLPVGKVTRMKFVVTLSAKNAAATTITLHTEDGTATSPADYRSKTQTITIPAGKRNKAFKVAVIPDSQSEGTEYFYAVIDSASVAVATNSAVGEIIDDDAAMPNAVANRLRANVLRATKGGLG